MLDELIDLEFTVEPDKNSHIIKTEPGESAAAKVTEARVLGTPVEALCGYIFVPQQNPDNLPLCQKCKDIYEGHRDNNPNLNKTPKQ